MVKRGIVVATDGKSATIEEIDGKFCDECIIKGANRNCLNCNKRTKEPAPRCLSENYIGAEIGDVVEYSKNKMASILLSLVTFVLPIVLMLVTYILLNQITANDQLSGGVALGVLALSMLCAALYSYKVTKYRCEYKIISRI